ncbi:MAG: Phosphate regulon transcriptional regulatory protein PhoB [Vampirovibrio sp.]|jgi:DNA-binding response OmpR family regulator|nr:Phosphate regulon transcriptional regulatory protein PhoB [Vampirovibrio sp.]
MKERILVVDDEKDLVNLVRYNLEKEGFEVDCAYNGSSVEADFQSRLPDLIILDLMLPDRSGYDICRDLKANPQTKDIPIIMLTARSSEYNRVTGFECGVEDYVIKPFSPRELTLRVKAILARTAGQRNRLQSDSNMIQLGQLSIFPDEFRVLVGQQEIPLTHTEFKILMALVAQPNRVKTREQILEAVWQEDAESVMDRTVDAQVKRLRAKLGEARDMVETVRGLGYRLKVAEARKPAPV